MIIKIVWLLEDKFVFRVYSSKENADEYIGMFLSSLFINGMPFYPIFPERLERNERYFNAFLKRNSKYFIGIKKDVFETLLKIARGNLQAISEIKLSQNKILNSLTCKYADGVIISDSNLIDYKGRYEM